VIDNKLVFSKNHIDHTFNTGERMSRKFFVNKVHHCNIFLFRLGRFVINSAAVNAEQITLLPDAEFFARPVNHL